MHNIKTNFDKILGVIKDILADEISEKGNYKRRGTKPKFSDIEVMALNLSAECLGIDSEKFLFEKTERVRKLLAEQLNKQADVFAIDSMPLEICKISREQRNKMGKESA